jgi:hypothetical protein
MDADKELTDAVDGRIEREIIFKQEIIDQINLIISELAFCDPTNAASTLNVSQDKLREIIGKLNDYHVIDEDASASISNLLNTTNLRRVPEVAPALPVAPGVPTAIPASPGSLPAPPTRPGRRPDTPPSATSATSPPAAPGTKLREMGTNLLNRSRNAARGFQNPNPAMPPVGIPQTPGTGGRRTRRRRKTRR